jgi:hypothetical protein
MLAGRRTWFADIKLLLWRFVDKMDGKFKIEFRILEKCRVARLRVAVLKYWSMTSIARFC